MHSCLTFRGEVTFWGASSGRIDASITKSVLDIKDSGDRKRKSGYRDPYRKLILDAPGLRFGKSAQADGGKSDAQLRRAMAAGSFPITASMSREAECTAAFATAGEDGKFHDSSPTPTSTAS